MADSEVHLQVTGRSHQRLAPVPVWTNKQIFKLTHYPALRRPIVQKRTASTCPDLIEAVYPEPSAAQHSHCALISDGKGQFLI
jgi:hypothetical protein